MPEVRFTIRWPDGSREACYSPSTVVRAHLRRGEAYPLDRFLALCEAALSEAALRVEQRHGYRCPRALAQLEALRARAAHQPPGAVQILAMG